jgi:uncharacterized protein (TIGR03382 family)
MKAKTQSIRISVLVAGVAVASASVGGLASANVITDWNQIALGVIRSNNTPPPMAARNLAIMHTAMYDAVNSLDQRYTPYASLFSGPSYASREAAAIMAAETVLSSLYSGRASEFRAARDTQLASIGDGLAKSAGITLGQTVGSAALAQRANDGSGTALPAFNGSTAVGQWRPTNGASGALPQWPGLTPFAMNSASQFRSAPPPALGSQEYADAYAQVKSLGAANSSTRTMEQSEIAMLWKAGANTVTPPGQWNQISAQLTANANLTLEDSARLFAQLNVSLADAGISAWDTKYLYNYWRPVTAIREGDLDGNVLTTGDASWTPYIPVTPNHPSYTSGHSTFSRAAAQTLTRFFGQDQMLFSLSNPDDAPGVTRWYNSFDAAANEAGMSRIYGGIHFMFDNTAGQLAGLQVADWVADNYFQAIPAPGSAGVLALAGVVAVRRRRK